MRYKTNTVMTKHENLPRIRAIVSPPATVDPTVVRPEVWEGLIVEAVARLDTSTVEIFGAETASQVLETWLLNGLTSGAARQYAHALRKKAFEQEGNGGAAPVQIVNVGENQAPPEFLTTLAAVFDYLAALTPPEGHIRFEDEATE